MPAHVRRCVFERSTLGGAKFVGKNLGRVQRGILIWNLQRAMRNQQGQKQEQWAFIHPVVAINNIKHVIQEQVI